MSLTIQSIPLKRAYNLFSSSDTNIHPPKALSAISAHRELSSMTI